MNIVGLGGSMSANSKSLLALELALDFARQLGATTEIVNVRDCQIGPYVPGAELDERSHTTLSYLEKVLGPADGILLCSPVYQDSISGSLKNLLDHVHDAKYEPVAFLGRSVGVMCVAEGPSVGPCLGSLAGVAKGMGGAVVPTRVGLSHAAFHEGKLLDPIAMSRVRVLASDVISRASHHSLEQSE